MNNKQEYPDGSCETNDGNDLEWTVGGCKKKKRKCEEDRDTVSTQELPGYHHPPKGPCPLLYPSKPGSSSGGIKFHPQANKKDSQGEKKKKYELEEKNNCLWIKDWKIIQTPQSTHRTEEVNSERMILSEYIAHEFPKITEQGTEQSSNVYSVPHTFPLSLVPTDGEKAEQMVFDKLKGLEKKIPGLKMVFFNGLRYTGIRQTDGGNKSFKEIDFSIFCKYLDNHFILLLEVKCCDTKHHSFTQKGLSTHRKKANNQLDTHISILKETFHIGEDSANKVQLHVVWPNLIGQEQCRCGQTHPRFQARKQNCLQPGTINPSFRPSGWHIFKENFAEDSFSNWFRQQIQDQSNAIDKESWMEILQIHTILSCGVLYNEMQKHFYLLGQDQITLLKQPPHIMSMPTLVNGVAGTGKTLTICQKLKELEPKLGPKNKALYICFSDNLINHVKTELKDRMVDIQFIKFINYEKNAFIVNFFMSANTMEKLITVKGFRHIFFDEAEDLGVEQISEICKSVKYRNCTTSKNPGYFKMTGEEVEGHFWILFDHYQSRLDQHGLGSVESTEKGESNFVWMGNSLDETLLTDVFKLRTIFRTTSSIARYIGDECLVPDWEIGEENGGYKISHNIQGLFPKYPEFIECFSIEDAYIKQELKKCIVRTIEESVQFKNNHPGDVAISLPDEDFNIIFGNSASEFVMHK